MAGTKRETYTERVDGILNVPYTGIEEADKEYAASKLNKELVEELQIDLYDFEKLTKAKKEEIAITSRDEIARLVRSYYQIQNSRIAKGSEIRAAIKQAQALGQEPPKLGSIQYIYNNLSGLENEIKKALDIWTDHDPVGSWCKQVTGIGPVIAAGLVTYFDISKAPSVSHFYSYSGLADNKIPYLGKVKAKAVVDKYVKSSVVTEDELIALAADKSHGRTYEKLHKMAWDGKKLSKESLIKGLSKPPYNADLKTLLWKMGESFVKVCNRDKSVYGKLYKARFAQEIARNEAGEFAEQAANILTTKNIGKTTEAYKAYASGKLPKSHLYMRTLRYVEKVFVSHLFDEMYIQYYNSTPPRLYVEVYLDHVDIIEPEAPHSAVDNTRPHHQPGNAVKYATREDRVRAEQK